MCRKEVLDSEVKIPGASSSLPTVVLSTVPVRPMTSSPKRLTLANVITVAERLERAQQRDREIDGTASFAPSPITGATSIRLDRVAGNGKWLVDQGGISFARPVCSGFCRAGGRRYVTGVHPERPGAPRCSLVRPKRGVLCLLHRCLRQPGESLRLAAVWLAQNEVSSACSIGVFGNQVSNCASLPYG